MTIDPDDLEAKARAAKEPVDGEWDYCAICGAYRRAVEAMR